MPKLPILSGREVIRILEKKFDFQLISQKGSHVKLRKVIENQTITTIVPDHKELVTGTLRGILKLAQIDIENFIRVYEDKF